MTNPLYLTPRWRNARRAYLAEHPLCAICQRQGRATAATVVDHRKPHGGDLVLFWDRSNWQAVCASCHSGVKRIEENHGYSQAADVDGNPIDPKHPWNRRTP